jgi:hypothetical protein
MVSASRIIGCRIGFVAGEAPLKRDMGSGGLRSRLRPLGIAGLALLGIGGAAAAAALVHHGGAHNIRSATASLATTPSSARSCREFEPLTLSDNPFSDWSTQLQTAYPSIYGGYADESAQAGGSVVVYETKTDRCFESQARETLPRTSQGVTVAVSFRTVPYSFATLDAARSRLTTCLMRDPGSTVWGIGMDTSEIVVSASNASKAQASLQRCGTDVAAKIEVGHPPTLQ